MEIKRVEFFHVFILLLFTCCSGYNFSINNFKIKDIPIVNIHNITRTSHHILYCADDSNEYFDFISQYNKNQTNTFVIYNYQLNKQSTIKDIVLRKTKFNTNIILVTNDLSKDVWNNTLLKLILTSKRNVINLVLTTKDPLYECDNDKLREEAFKNIENFLDKFWKKTRMFHVILSLPFVCGKFVVVYDNKNYRRDSNRPVKLISFDDKAEIHQAVTNNNDLIRGYPLRASIFERFPTSVKHICVGKPIARYMDFSKNYSAGYCGMDGMIMYDVVKNLQFHLVIPDLNITEYGYILPNGTITGSLGAVINKQVDISFNSRFILRYTGSDDHVFLRHVWKDSLCACYNWPRRVPLWKYPLYAFKTDIWITTVATFTLVGLARWILTRISKKVHGCKEDTILCTLVTYYVVLGMCGISLSKKVRSFVVTGPVLFCSVVLLSIYQGYINYSFSTQVRHSYISTLEELQQSGVTVFTSTNIKSLLKTSELDKDNQRNIEVWANEKANNKSLAFIIDNPHSATVERLSDLELAVLKDFKDENGDPMIDAVDECYRNYLLAYIATKDYLFSIEIHRQLTRLLEAGLPTMYYKWTKQSIGVYDYNLKKLMRPLPRPNKKITLQDQIIALGLLACGYILTSIVFAVEMYHGRRTRKYGTEESHKTDDG